MKDLTCIYGLRLLSVALSRIFMLFTLVCIVVMFFVLHGLKIQAIFFFLMRPRGGSGFRKKTRLINGAGSGTKKPDPYPTRCHSYICHSMPVCKI